MADERTQQLRYLEALIGLPGVLKLLGEQSGAVSPALVAVPAELPRQGDSPETLLAWRTLLEKLHGLIIASEDVAKMGLVIATILMEHIHEAGLQDVILPPIGPSN